jgi:hypothetical protein
MTRNSTAPLMRQRLSSLAVALTCSALVMAQSQAPSTPLVLSHVNVVDVTTGSLRRDFDVTIRGGRIAAVAAACSEEGKLVFGGEAQRDRADEALNWTHLVLLDIFELLASAFDLPDLRGRLEGLNHDYLDIWHGHCAPEPSEGKQ